MSDQPIYSYGALYFGAISPKNKVDGTLVTNGNEIVFYQKDTNKMVLRVSKNSNGYLIFTTNSINFRFDNRKIAFVPHSARLTGTAAGLGGAAGIAYAGINYEQSGLGTWKNYLQQGGFTVKNRGLSYTVGFGLGAFALVIFLILLAGYLLFKF